MAESDDRAKVEAQVRALGNLVFPSDGLTLGELRKRTKGDWQAAELLIHNMTSLERELAWDVLSETTASGTERARVSAILQEEKARELSLLYVEAGVTTGQRHAKQLIKSFQSAVAGRFGPGTPS
jgi:hypothetical protein